MEHVERTTSLEPVEEQELVDPDLTTESRDWSSELIDAIKDLGIAFDGLNIHTIDPGQSTPLTRELINAEYACLCPPKLRPSRPRPPEKPLSTRPRKWCPLRPHPATIQDQ